MKTKEITLSDGKKISVREPKVRDLLVVDDISGEKQQELALIGNLTEMPKDALMDLSIPDYKRLQEAIHDFLA